MASIVTTLGWKEKGVRRNGEQAKDERQMGGGVEGVRPRTPQARCILNQECGGRPSRKKGLRLPTL